MSESENTPRTVSMCVLEVGEVSQTTKINKIEMEIDRKSQTIDGISVDYLKKLKCIMLENSEVFWEGPECIDCHEHEFQSKDNTLYFLCGWPVPLPYQEQIDCEIKKMLQYGVIKRASSPYINPMVTVIKKAGMRIYNIFVPDFEEPLPVQEILAQCSKMKVMSMTDLVSGLWKVPLKEHCRDYTTFVYQGSYINLK